MDKPRIANRIEEQTARPRRVPEQATFPTPSTLEASRQQEEVNVRSRS